MPYFTQRKPATIANSIAAMLGSSSRLTPSEEAGIELKASQINHQNAIAEKARAEVQAMRAAQAAREDPNNAIQLGSFASGIDVPAGEQLYRAMRGMVAPNAVANDDEGNVLPEARYQAPENISPEQRRAFGGAIAAHLANLLATGKTNADQLAHAAGRFNENAVRNAAVGLPPEQQNALVGPFRASAREPFSGGVNAQGMTVNQETGQPVIASKPLHDAAIQAVQNLGAQREAAAALAESRAALAEARARGGAGGNGRGSGAKPPTGYRWVEGDDGQMALEPIPGGPKDPKGAAGKPLPGPATKRLEEAGTAVEDTRRLASTFKDRYGGNTILGGMANTVQRVFGDATPDAIAAEGQAQWWQDMDTLQNQTRHTLFGSALTATELAAWNKTSITPRMDPKQIRENLARRQEIEARAASKLARSYEAAGYNKNQIRELLGTAAEYLDSPAPPATQRGASGSWGGDERRSGPAQPLVSGERRAPPVGTTQRGYRFKGGDPSNPRNWEKVT